MFPLVYKPIDMDEGKLMMLQAASRMKQSKTKL